MSTGSLEFQRVPTPCMKDRLFSVVLAVNEHRGSLSLVRLNTEASDFGNFP